MEENKIIVIYVGIAGLRSEDIEQYVMKLKNKISPTSVNGEVIFIPTQSYDTRIDCINPKYITDRELIQEHTNMMHKLENELKIQLDILKTKNHE